MMAVVAGTVFPPSKVLSSPLPALMRLNCPPSIRRGDTVIIMGAYLGVRLGAWANYQLGFLRGPPLEMPYPILWPAIDQVRREKWDSVDSRCQISLF